MNNVIGHLKILMASIPLRGHNEFRGGITEKGPFWCPCLGINSRKGITFISADTFPFEKEELQILYKRGIEWDIDAFTSHADHTHCRAHD